MARKDWIAQSILAGLIGAGTTAIRIKKYADDQRQEDEDRKFNKEMKQSALDLQKEQFLSLKDQREAAAKASEARANALAFDDKPVTPEQQAIADEILGHHLPMTNAMWEKQGLNLLKIGPWKGLMESRTKAQDALARYNNVRANNEGANSAAARALKGAQANKANVEAFIAPLREYRRAAQEQASIAMVNSQSDDKNLVLRAQKELQSINATLIQEGSYLRNRFGIDPEKAGIAPVRDPIEDMRSSAGQSAPPIVVNTGNQGSPAPSNRGQDQPTPADIYGDLRISIAQAKDVAARSLTNVEKAAHRAKIAKIGENAESIIAAANNPKSPDHATAISVIRHTNNIDGWDNAIGDLSSLGISGITPLNDAAKKEAGFYENNPVEGSVVKRKVKVRKYLFPWNKGPIVDAWENQDQVEYVGRKGSK